MYFQLNGRNFDVIASGFLILVSICGLSLEIKASITWSLSQLVMMSVQLGLL